MIDQDIHQIIPILRQQVKAWTPALVDGMAAAERNPYKILITTILSLRTKDTLTAQVAPRLFALADTPTRMVMHTAEEIAAVIYPVGFYRNKAQSILAISQTLLNQYEGQVPAQLDQLLALPGVGRKTANLVLAAGFNIPAICVDIHVHRISNRWGYVQTASPEATELVLREKLPLEYWLEYNGLLVTFGQNLCTPTSPWCSRCLLTAHCARAGVTKTR